MRRALATTLATLAVLLAAGGLLLAAAGGPALPPQAGLAALDPAALGTGLRLLAWSALTLLALLLVLRVAVALALLLDLGYAPLVALGQALLLPAVRRTAGGLTAGALLAGQFAGGGGPAGAAPPPRSSAGVIVAGATAAAAGAAGGSAGPRADHGATAGAGRASAAARALALVAPGRRAHRQQTRAHVLLGRGRACQAGALTYTVQWGDTLSGIARRFYGDVWAYARLFQANHGLRQPDDTRLTTPDLIRAGWHLRVPLPSRVARLAADGSLRYVVQEGDSLTAISGQLLGDWRRFRELVALNRSQRQPDGGALTDPALIQPGWILRVPANGLLAPRAAPCPPQHRPAAHRPVLLWRHARMPRPRRSGHGVVAAPSPPPLAGSGPAGPGAGQPMASGRAPRPPAARAAAVVRPQRRASQQAPVSRGQLGGPLARHPAPAGPPAPSPGAGATTPLPSWPASPARSVPHGERAPAAGPPPARAPRAPTAALAAVPRPARSTPRTRPTLLLPDGRLLPTGLVATFLGLLALVAWRRRRATGAPAVPWLLTTPPLRGTVGAVLRPGLPGWLAAVASGRLRGDEGDRVPPVLATLEAVWAERGWGRPQVRWVRESEDTVVLCVEADPAVVRAVLATAADDLARRVGGAARRVRPTRGGVLLPLEGVPAALRDLAPPPDGAGAPAGAWGPGGPPHPVPLLVPLGSPADGMVLHVNLAALPTLLVAGGPLGDAPSRLLALLTQVVAQARPTQVRLLLAGEAGGGLDQLHAVPHLAAPLADAEDPAALAALLQAAEEALLATMQRQQTATPCDAPAGAGGGAGQDARGSVLLVVEEVASLLAHPALLARFDTLCRAGAQHGLVVLAGTTQVRGLAAPRAQGLLSAFRGRLVSRLDDATASVACLGEEGAELLGERELLWTTAEGAPECLAAFSLRAAEAREILTAQAAAVAPDAPEDGSALPLLPSSSPTPAGEEDEDEGAAGARKDGGGTAASGAAEGLPAGQALLAGPGDEHASTTPPQIPSAVPEQQEEVERAAEHPTVERQDDGSALGAAAMEDPAHDDGEEADHGRGGVVPVGPQRHAADTRPVWARPRPGVLLNLRLLGGLDLAIGGRVVPEGPAGLARNTREYLAYLALQRGAPRAREVIQLAFWPEATSSQGERRIQSRRQRLRTFLARQWDVPTADALLPREGDRYWLALEQVWVDALAFEAALDAADAAGDDQEWRDLLLAALALYGGDLLGAGQDYPWAEEEGHRLRGLFLDAALTVGTLSLRAGDLPTALVWGERLTREEPSAQAYARLLMRAQQRTGGREAVRRTYQRLRQHIKEEEGEGAEPGERTLALYAQLMAADEAQDEEEMVVPRPAASRQAQPRPGSA